ncbi:MAG: hypothetical protein WB800_08125, partial [Streptosporangiaceae bacterium]
MGLAAEAVGVGVGVGAGVVGVGVGAGADVVGDEAVGGDEGCGPEEPPGPGAGDPELNGFGAWPGPVSGTGSSPRCDGVSTPGSAGLTRWCLFRGRLAGPSISGEIAVVAAGVGFGLAATVFTAAVRGACVESAAIRYRIAVGTASATSVTEESSITFGPPRRGRSGTG